jgi:hypothetical protein
VRVLLFPVMDGVHKALVLIRGVLEKLVKLVTYAAEHHLPVVSMIVQTFNWVNDVQKPMSALSGDVTRPRDDYLDEWRGDVADKYRTKAGEQLTAIKDVSKKAAFISAWLMSIAKDNVEWMASLTDFAIEVLGKLAAAAVKTGSVIGIPDALGDCSDLVGKAVEVWLTKLREIGTRFVGAVSNARDLSSEMSNVEAFPLGVWPQAVRG